MSGTSKQKNRGWLGLDRSEFAKTAWMLAIVLFSVCIGIGVSWRLPELDLAAHDSFLRHRGRIAPPAEIVIIAIDEESIARLGRFPWQRRLMASCIDRISAAQPKVIALDVLYSEPTTPSDDQALATAIASAKNVVVASQLIKTIGDNGESRVAWLRPLPEIEKAAAAVGHVNVVPGYDGVLRGLLLRQADDEGEAFWAMTAETMRVAESRNHSPVRETLGAVEVGRRRIPVDSIGDEITLGSDVSAGLEQPGFEQRRALKLHLDFVGPGGSFLDQTYRFSDALEGKIDPAKLRDKYVLIGATAAALGDRMATPFVYFENKLESRNQELTSGVEILANSLHTILRERYVVELPDWLTLLLTTLASAGVCLAMTLFQGRWEGMKQIAVVMGSVALVWPIAYFAFTRWLIIPPVTPIMMAGVTAALFVLLRRTLSASAGLEARISELASWDAPLGGSSGLEAFQATLPTDPTKMIAGLTGANAVAILAGPNGGPPALAACFGAAFRTERLGHPGSEPEAALSVSQALLQESPANDYFALDQSPASVDQRALIIKLGDRSEAEQSPSGELILAYPATMRPSNESLMLVREIAASFLARAQASPWPRGKQRGRWSLARLWPRGAAWKVQLLGRLQQRMITRSLFVEQALQSVDDGLLIATADGVITFANPRAAAIFGVSERGLIGGDLLARLDESERTGGDKSLPSTTQQTLFRLLVERCPVEREITIRQGVPRQYVIRMSAVGRTRDGSAAPGPALGLVATLSDVTKQYELQKAKNDVMALVSHELRTPLTAIQGISEVLTRYEVDPDRRNEMHLAIHDESKRLARMIDEYLDLTRIETGARPLRLEPIRVTQLLERVLLLLEPVAAEREIRIGRRFAPNLPVLTADPDLIARAVTNLMANAVKFSSPRHDVLVEACAEGDYLRLDVKDQGCGIPPESLPFVFEKFYRVPRLEDADDHGTGMGLAFVRDIAQRHGGQVTVESESGIGSVFTLRLPFVQNQLENQDVETSSLNR
jgi:two-component system phosphate regulon sensor histidine kinase PhoR